MDCLFNNPGAGESAQSIEYVTADRIRQQFDLPVTAVLLGMEHVTPIMKRQGGGSIVNNAAIAAFPTGYGPPIYGAAKAAAIQATKWVFTELAAHEIRVNPVSPGAVCTPIFAKVWDPEGKDQATMEKKLREEFAQSVPVGRAGDGTDVAALRTYLASDESSFITGLDIPIDRGITAGLSWAQQSRMWTAVFEAIQR